MVDFLPFDIDSHGRSTEFQNADTVQLPSSSYESSLFSSSIKIRNSHLDVSNIEKFEQATKNANPEH